MSKEKINVSLDSEVIETLKYWAKAESMQVSPYLQLILRAHFGMSKILPSTTKTQAKPNADVLTPVNKLDEVATEVSKIDDERKAKIMAEWSDDE